MSLTSHLTSLSHLLHTTTESEQNWKHLDTEIHRVHNYTTREREREVAAVKMMGGRGGGLGKFVSIHV